MKEIINAAFIGVGNFVNRQHLPNAYQNPKYCVHTLCDLREDLLRERAETYQPLKTTSDYHDVLNDPDVDLVFIGTRGDLHARFIVEVANAGKHIMVEKPMTHTWEETAEAVRAVVDNNVRLLVGFNRRASAPMLEAKRLFNKVRNGPVNMLYRMATDVMHAEDYYAFDLKKGGGHLIYEGVHILDLITWMVDSEPIRIYAQGSVHGDDNTTITYADGSVASFLLSRNGGQCYPKEAMEAFTGRSTIVMDQFFEVRADLYGDRFVREFYPAKWDEVDEVPGTTGSDGGIELHYQKSVVLRAKDQYWEKRLQPDKGHYHALDLYADALLNGTAAPCDEIDGARATTMALKAYESIRQNAAIEIKPDDYFLNMRRTWNGNDS